MQRIGTLGLAEQEMTAADERTVGQAVADSIAEPLAALATFDAAARALANGIDGAAEEYAASLELAEALDASVDEVRARLLNAIDEYMEE